MVQMPGDDHALWHFWSGPDREFSCWYVNIQEAFRRTPIGFDTQDLELDIVVPPDGPWEFKDQELLAEHVQRGRYTAEQVERVVALGDSLAAELDADRRWWDEKWSTWTPDPSWGPVDLPPGWQSVPT
jgi:predicted RNA-binding protein associated with RNAse of E/G family